MRNIGLLLIAVTAVVSLAAQASAQRIGTPPRQFMLLNPKVQTELKLTEAQKQAVTKAAGDSVSTDEQGRIRMKITQGTDLDTIQRDLKKVLTSAQDKRLTEIWIQKEGSVALNDADIAKSVGLSADQKKRVDGIVDDMMDEIRDIAMSNGGRVNAEQSKELKERTKKKLDAVLSADQKAKFEALKGKPFKMA